MADSVGGDMIRGHIDSIILNSLLDGDKDTNQIRTEIEKKAGGSFKIKQGTFYSALQRITKQGLVTDYRTTGIDGVRRKFYQLTEKGKAHIEKGQSNWSQSQTVISKLLDLDNERNEDFMDKNIVVSAADSIVIPSFGSDNDEDTDTIEDFTAISEEEYTESEYSDNSLFSTQISEEDDEYEPLDNSNDSDVAELLNALNGETETATIVPDVVTDTYFQATHECDSAVREPEKVEIIPEINNDFDTASDEDEYVSSYNTDISTDSFASSFGNKNKSFENDDFIDEEKFHIDEKPAEGTLDEEVTEPTSIESSPSTVITNEKFDSSDFIESNSPNEDDSDKVDDYLYPNDIPDQREYKDILAKIFDIAENKKEKTENEPIQVLDFEQKNDESIKMSNDTDDVDSNENSVIVDELDLDDRRVKETPETVISEEDRKLNEKNNKFFDFSDIIALSEKEGFKVSTSDKTNRTELGKILVNKLNFHSSILFFLLMAIETLIVALTMENVLSFGTTPYVIFGLIILILPLLCGTIYFISPKRAVLEIRSFKDAFETALIVTLNAMIAVLVIAVIFDIDFTSYSDVARMIFIPIIIAINIPLYVVIRYSLLDKHIYYS